MSFHQYLEFTLANMKMEFLWGKVNFRVSELYILRPNWEQQPVPNIYLLNSTTRMPFEILFTLLIGAIVFPFALSSIVFKQY